MVGAHLDDIEFGLGGSLARYSTVNTIRAIVLCNGRSAEDSTHRKKAFVENMLELKIPHQIFEIPDLTLHNNFREVVSILQEEVNTYMPDVVFGPCESDLHRDHQVVGESLRLTCRPIRKCSVREFYQYKIPGSSDWSFIEHHFNVGFDISKYIETKVKLCRRYIGEIKEDDTHPCSLSGIKITNESDGKIFGFNYCEVARLIFKRD